MSDASLVTLDGVLDNAKAAGKGDEGKVKRWMLEINLADKLEKDWRKVANGARDIYRGKKKSQNSFNILWANTEVIRPNLYNSTPKPDVRRRYRDADPQGKAISEVLERSLSFEADSCDFDGVMEAAVFDSALPGRGTARICFEPYYDTIQGEDGKEVKNLAGAKCYPEHVAWDSFRRGSAATWQEVPWLAYYHAMTMDEVKDKFPGLEKKVSYDVTIAGVAEEKANLEPTVYKRVSVWEIWDKEGKKILWIAPSFEEAPLLEEEDKLKLKDFFDMPKPIYSVDDTATLEPICEYSLYEEQAKELNRVTQRINKLTEMLKVRGIYDSTLTEIANLLTADDGEMLPTKDATIALQAGGFDKAIWMQPLEQIAKVLAQLYVQREQIKMTIYEVIGISDILRGQSDPSETLGAQELKAQSGSVRLQRRQREVQRFARDVFRIMSEIISEHYPAELLTIMTGVQVTPEMQQIMQRDLLRGIRVDVETDSTIAADQSRTRKDMAEVMEAVGGFVTNFGPAVESGAVSMEAAKKILTSIVRKARLGRDVEDAIEQDSQQPQQPKPDPAMLEMQGKQELEKQKLDLDNNKEQAKAQNDAAKIQADKEVALAKEANSLTLEREKIASTERIKEYEINANYEIAMKKAAIETSAKKEIEAQKTTAQQETARETAKINSKPMIQLDTGGALDSVVVEIGKMAQTMVQGQADLAQTLAQGQDSINKTIAHLAKPKKAVSRRNANGDLEATIEAV